MIPTWKTHMSEKEAIQMYDSGWWQDATDEAILDRQLFERRTIMPFGISLVLLSGFSMSR